MTVIRPLIKSDIFDLMLLVAESKPHHIFAKDSSSILYYHFLEYSNSLAINGAFTESGQLVGAHFYEPITFLQSHLQSIYGCLLVTSSFAPLGAGLQLLEYTLSLTEQFYVATNVSSRMRRFHQRLGLSFVEMDKFFAFNPSASARYIINQNTDNCFFYHANPVNSHRITTIDDLASALNSINVLSKNVKQASSLYRKYLLNPFHHYDVIFTEHPSPSLVVIRKQYRNSSFVVKVVEYICQEVNIDALFEIISSNYFIDPLCEGAYFYCFTHLPLSYSRISKFDFSSLTSSDFIPTHFHPFSFNPISINCCHNSTDLLICSGDSDQDRASL